MLQNGKGPIWPTKVTLAGGQPYVDQDFQLKKIQIARQSSIKFAIWLAIIEAVFALFAFRLVAKHKLKLEREI